MKLFVDNNLESELNTQGAIPDDNNLPIIRIGANFLKQDNFFVGNIQNLLLWNRSLNTNEISSFFTNNTIPTGTVVDVRANTSNIDYVDEISSLNFNGTNYFDLKLSPNITKGLVKPFHLEKN